MSSIANNLFRKLAAFFSDGSRTVSINEFVEFWNSLSEKDKDYYWNAV
jgi:hypothetical protein